MSLKTIIMGGCTCVVAFGLLSCADVPSTGPQFPDFRTQSRFISAVPGGAVQIMIEPTSQAGLSLFKTLDFQGATGYEDVAAGARKLKLQTDPDTTTLTFDSDAKLTVLVLPRESVDERRFQIYKERRTFDKPFDTLPDSVNGIAIKGKVGQVRFINAGMDADYDIWDMSDSTVVFDMASTEEHPPEASNLTFRQSTGYFSLVAGNYTLGLVQHDSTDVLKTVDVNVGVGERYTTIIFGDLANVAVKAFKDD